MTYASTPGARAGIRTFPVVLLLLSQSNAYFVRPLLKGKEGEPSAAFTLQANTPARQYLSIPLRTPEGYAPGEDGEGTGRGLCFDIDPERPGFECWVRRHAASAAPAPRRGEV